ncbi:MAG TPA: hypothetical protein VK171_15155 [Fimbriimonas sp.]|nr:hypothetical protein [Fimbriimonas sp.]
MNNLLGRYVATVALATTLLACFGGSGSGGINPPTKIVYMVEAGNTIIKYDLESHVRTPFLALGSEVKHLRVSPDGRHLLYVQNDILRSVRDNTTEQRTFTGYKAGDWNADGSKIFAVSSGDNIYSLNPDGTGASAALASGTNIESIDVDSAGTKMVVVWSNTGWKQVVHLTLGGTVVATLTNTGNSSELPRWSPDGANVVYDRDNTIWRNSATGTGATEEAIMGSVAYPSCPVYQKSGSILFIRNGDLYQADADGTNSTSLYHSPNGLLSWPDPDTSGT